MSLCVLRMLGRSSFTTHEAFALLVPAWKKKFELTRNTISTSSCFQSSKIDQIKASNIFDQAQTFSEQINKGKKARVYESDSESDSDSDIENMKKVDAYTSDFWRQKMRTMHGIFDVNNDGVISFDDFLMLAQKFGDLGHLSEKEMANFLGALKTIWESNWGVMEPYNTISVEQYLTDMHHVMTDKDLRKKVHKFLPFLFQAVDADCNNAISIDEFKMFFKCLGLTEKDAEISFRAIDKNGDRSLSIKEFVKLGRDFFLTEDPKHVSKNFWGPLVSPH